MENTPDVLGTLEEIRDLLTPKPVEPIKVESNDQAGLNANLDAIATGKAVVIPATITPRSYGAGVKQIKSSDQRTIDRSVEEIATGKAVIVD